MTGTKSGGEACALFVATAVTARQVARRQPNTCCEQTCQRRATSDTRAPGSRVSAMIRAFWSADQRRRRPGPVRTSTRRNSPFASSLTSNITIARSPLPWATQPFSGRSLKKGIGATLPLLQHVLPINAGTSPETLRSHTLQVGRWLGDAAAEKPPIAATAITISLDSTLIRSRDEGERHLEVRVGNVETVDGGRPVFGAVARADTDLTALLQRQLETVGRTDATEVTAFTDGCPGLRTVLANAGGL